MEDFLAFFEESFIGQANIKIRQKRKIQNTVQNSLKLRTRLYLPNIPVMRKMQDKVNIKQNIHGLNSDYFFY